MFFHLTVLQSYQPILKILKTHKVYRNSDCKLFAINSYVCVIKENERRKNIYFLCMHLAYWLQASLRLLFELFLSSRNEIAGIPNTNRLRKYKPKPTLSVLKIRSSVKMLLN